MPQGQPKIPSTFCALPWTHLFVGNLGDFASCCLSYSENDPFQTDAGKTILFQEPNSVAAAWNSAKAKQIRTQMLRGERPSACQACYQREDNGFPSVRQSKNASRAAQIPAMIAHTQPDGSAPLNLFSLDIRLGNSCNLKCRMCYPNSSLPMALEWKKLGWIQQEDLEKVQNLDWYEQRENWIPLLTSDSLHTIEFAGGEPLQNPSFHWALDFLIESGRASKLKLAFTSNLTLLPDLLLEKFTKFKTVSGLISFDGTREVNSYIRFPSNWNRFEENLQKFDRFCANRDWEIRLHTTVQAYNALNLGDIFTYSLQFENFSSIEFSFLHTPNYLSALALPPEVLEKAKANIENALHSIKTWPSHWEAQEVAECAQKAQELLHFLQNPSSAQFSEFVARTIALDQARNQSIEAYIPELSAYFPAQVSSLANPS